MPEVVAGVVVAASRGGEGENRRGEREPRGEEARDEDDSPSESQEPRVDCGEVDVSESELPNDAERGENAEGAVVVDEGSREDNGEPGGVSDERKFKGEEGEELRPANEIAGVAGRGVKGESTGDTDTSGRQNTEMFRSARKPCVSLRI